MPRPKTLRSVTRRVAAAAAVALFSGMAPGAPIPGVLAADPIACESVYRGTPIERLSVTTAGGQGAASSYGADMSSDGKYVTFVSGAVLDGDANGASDVFLRDVAAKRTELVSKTHTGAAPSSNSVAGAVSDTGRYVAFASTATDVVAPPDANPAVDLNGTTGQITSPHSALYNLTGATTFEAWVKLDTNNRHHMILTKTVANGATNSTFEWRLAPSGYPEFLQYAGGTLQKVVGTMYVYTDKWAHLAVVKTGTTVTHYLNGVANGTGQITGVVSTNTRPVVVGARDDQAAHFLDGGIDEVAIYSTALSATRISEHYRANAVYPATVRADAPVAYWRLDEATGTTANDSSVGGLRDATYSTTGVLRGQTGALATDPDNVTDIYVRDRETGTNEKVSVSTGKISASRNSEDPSISADGNLVAFASHATNLVGDDTNGVADVFVHDRTTKTTTRVSTTATGTQATGGASNQPMISRDGTTVVFTSAANDIVPGDANGKTDVFSRNLAAAAGSAGSVVRVSVGDTLDPNGASSHPSVSKDGKRVAFQSSATDLVANDTNAATDVFVRDIGSAKTELASRLDDETLQPGGGTYPSISGNGRYVTFGTRPNFQVATNLHQRDLTLGRTFQISPAGESPWVAEPSPMSADGTKTAFGSTGALVPGDTNAYGDVFLQDQGPATASEAEWFATTWATRVRNEAWTRAWLTTTDHDAAVAGEGYHSRTDTTKRFLVDCLHAELDRQLPPGAGWQPADEAEYKAALYEYVFDKGKITDPAPDPMTGPTTAVTAPGPLLDPAIEARLAGIAPVAIPGDAARIFPALTGARRAVDADALLAAHPSLGLRHQLPTEPADVAAALDAGQDARPTIAALATAAEAAAGTGPRPGEILPRPEMLPVSATYEVCHRSASAPNGVCTGPRVIGEPTLVDVTGDGTVDVQASFAPVGDPTSVPPQLVATRFDLLRVDPAPAQPLRAHVWVTYESPAAEKRFRVGFDGLDRGDTLLDSSTVSFGVDDVPAAVAGHLESSYTVTNTTTQIGLVGRWALTVSAEETSEDAEGSRSPVDASLMFSPAPTTVRGEVDRCAVDADDPDRAAQPPAARCAVTGTSPDGTTFGQDMRELHVSAIAPERPALDVLAHRTRTVSGSSDSRVERITTSFTAGRMPATADLTVTELTQHRQQGGPVRVSEVVMDNSDVVVDARVRQWHTLDTAGAAETRKVLSATDVAAAATVRWTSEDRHDEVKAELSTPVTRIAFGDNRYDDAGALVGSRSASVEQVPASTSVVFDRRTPGAGSFRYTASSVIPEIEVGYLDATGDRVQAHARAEDVPRSIAVEFDTTTKTASYTAGPTESLGLFDAAAGLSGGRPYRPAGDHVTVSRAGEGMGFGARLTGLKALSGSFANDRADLSVTFLPGGQPFLMAYRDEQAYGLVRVSNLPATVTVGVSAAKALDYTASAPISKVSGFYTNRVAGPTVQAEVTGVPTDFEVRVSSGQTAGFTLDGNAPISGLAAMFSPDSVTTVDQAVDRYVSARTTALPAYMDLDVDMTAGALVWTASAPVAEVTVGARGMWGPGTALAAGVKGIPASFRADFPKGSMSFTPTSGPIGAIYLAFTNHGSVQVERDTPHATLHRAVKADTYDGSALLTNIGAARFAKSETGFEATATVDLAGKPFLVDLSNEDAATGGTTDEFRTAVRGTFDRLPSTVDVSYDGTTMVYDANDVIDADFDVEAGWIGALDAIPAPRVRHGVSARDGGCGTEQGCRPAVDRTLCTAQECQGVKAHLMLLGLPTHVELRNGDGVYVVRGYAPPADRPTFGVHAAMHHVTPVKGEVDVTIGLGTPLGAPLDMTLGPFTSTGGDGEPTKVAFKTELTRDLGPIDVRVNVPAAGEATDLQGHVYLSELPRLLSGSVTLKDGADVQLVNSGPVTRLLAEAAGSYKGLRAAAFAELTDVPATVGFDVNTATTPAADGNGVFPPGLTYTASADTLDVTLGADARYVLNAKRGVSVGASVRARIRDLGRDASIVAVFKNDAEGQPTSDLESIRVTSTPPAAEVSLSVGVRLNVAKQTFQFDKGTDRVRLDVEGHVALDAGIDKAEIAFRDVGGAELVPGKFYLAWGLRPYQAGPMGTFQMRLDNPGILIDLEIEARLRTNFRIANRSFDRAYSVAKLDLYDADPSTEQQDAYGSFVFHAAADRRGAWLETVRRFRGVSGVLDCAPIDMRPQPVLARGPNDGSGEPGTNGMTLPPAGEEATERFVFTFVDPGGDVPDALIDLAVAGYLSPFDKEIAFDVTNIAGCF